MDHLLFLILLFQKYLFFKMLEIFRRKENLTREVKNGKPNYPKMQNKAWVYLPEYMDTGYPHDGRADKDSYPHDGRADKDSYPHARHINNALC